MKNKQIEKQPGVSSVLARGCSYHPMLASLVSKLYQYNILV